MTALTPPSAAELAKEYARLGSIAALGDRYGISKDRMAKWLRAAGVPVGTPGHAATLGGFHKNPLPRRNISLGPGKGVREHAEAILAEPVCQRCQRPYSVTRLRSLLEVICQPCLGEDPGWGLRI